MACFPWQAASLMQTVGFFTNGTTGPSGHLSSVPADSAHIDREAGEEDPRPAGTGDNPLNAATTQTSRTFQKEEAWWSHFNDIERIQRDGLVTPERTRRWKYRQRVAMHSGLLPEDKAAALARLGIHPFASPAAREWAARYEAFIDEHGRTPSQIGDDVHERELDRAARRYKLGHVFDTTGLENRRTIANEKLWQENFAILRRWTEAHGRMPKMRAPDVAESTMANFVNVQRRHLAAGKLPERREDLLRGIRGVLEPRIKDRGTTAWGVMLEEFFVENGRLPFHASSDAAERSLRLAMDRHGIEVSADVKREVWWRNMKTVTRWCAANGRLPSAGSGNEAEAQAAVWWQLKRWQMLTTGPLDLEAERAIGLLLMGLSEGKRYPEPCSPIWLDQLETLRAFREAFRRFPKRCTDPLENALAAWVRGLRVRHTWGSLPEEAVRILQETVPGVIRTQLPDRAQDGLAA